MEKLLFDEKTHTYFYEGKSVPSVSQILLDEGFINTQYFTEEGRNRGSAVHKAIENHCKGAHCIFNPKTEPYLVAFKNFQRDCDWIMKHSELQMGSRLFAGTMDMQGLLNGNEAILDVKTSEVISPASQLQLAAYEELYRLYLLEKGEGVPLLIKRFILQLTNTGKYILTECKDRNDKYIFTSAVALFHWKKNHKVIK